VALSGAILIVATATVATTNRVCFSDYLYFFFLFCVAVEAPKAFRQMPAKRRIKKINKIKLQRQKQNNKKKGADLENAMQKSRGKNGERGTKSF